MKLLIGSSLNAQINTGISDRRKANIPVEFDRRQGDRRQSSAPVENDRRRINFAADSDKRGNDRRQVSIPVEFDRRQGDRRNISFTNDEEKHKVIKQLPKENIVFDALEALPPVRRIVSIPDKLEQDDRTAALGAASLALINLPEDIRDIRGAYNQLKGIKPSYDYTQYQHPFSFFRGTLLHDFANPYKSTHPELADKLLQMDKDLSRTRFGEKLLGLLDVKVDGMVKTPIKNINHTDETPNYIRAYKYKATGKFAKFGELTARAMTRTTLLGVTAMGLLELPKIIKVIRNGNNIQDKTINTSKQLLKSSINVALITTGIAYSGAIGFKKFGAAGSLIGMGFGAVLGSYISRKLRNVIN